MKVKKYFKVWWIFAINSFQSQLNVRWPLLLFLLGKILRFFTFTFFIVVLVNRTSSLAGYNLYQTILFYLSFNFVDNLAQLIFREVYRFRPAVVSGTFDFYLVKPFNPLFRSLTAGPDLLDFITMIPLVIAIIFFISKLQVTDPINLITYCFLLMIGFLIALSFHILVLSLAIVTTEIDHAVMVYRDITSMGRMPIDIYIEPIKSLLTFVIPVGIMMSFPTKSLLGILSPVSLLYSVAFTVVFLYISLKIWNWSLKQYSSASS